MSDTKLVPLVEPLRATSFDLPSHLSTELHPPPERFSAVISVNLVGGRGPIWHSMQQSPHIGHGYPAVQLARQREDRGR